MRIKEVSLGVRSGGGGSRPSLLKKSSDIYVVLNLFVILQRFIARETIMFTKVSGGVQHFPGGGGGGG